MSKPFTSLELLQARDGRGDGKIESLTFFFFLKIPSMWWCFLKTRSNVFLWILLSVKNKCPHSANHHPIPVSGNCAHFHKGGWWYNACGQSNLNGVWYTGGVYRSKFQDGIFWADYGGGFYSMKSVRILIRPIDWGETANQAGPGATMEAGANLSLILNCDCTCHKQLAIHKRTTPMEIINHHLWLELPPVTDMDSVWTLFSLYHNRCTASWISGTWLFKTSHKAPSN